MTPEQQNAIDGVKSVTSNLLANLSGYQHGKLLPADLPAIQHALRIACQLIEAIGKDIHEAFPDQGENDDKKS